LVHQSEKWAVAFEDGKMNGWLGGAFDSQTHQLIYDEGIETA